MRRKICMILTAVSGVLAVVILILALATDRKGPSITIPDDGSSYTDGEADTDLLQSVTATDKRDGDVTDTLRVESVSKPADGTEASVVYAAKDDAGNVTLKTRKMPVAGAAAGEDTSADAAAAENAGAAAENAASSAASASGETEAQSGSETASAASSENAESAAESVATPTPDPETQAEQADEAVRNTLAADAPRLYLKVHYVTLSVGEKFSYMSYISQLTDDKDSSATLSQRINVGGAASSGKLDTSTPGNYDVEYSCDDSDGNKSNVAILHVTVQ